VLISLDPKDPAPRFRIRFCAAFLWTRFSRENSCPSISNPRAVIDFVVPTNRSHNFYAIWWPVWKQPTDRLFLPATWTDVSANFFDFHPIQSYLIRSFFSRQTVRYSVTWTASREQEKDTRSGRDVSVRLRKGRKVWWARMTTRHGHCAAFHTNMAVGWHPLPFTYPHSNRVSRPWPLTHHWL